MVEDDEIWDGDGSGEMSVRDAELMSGDDDCFGFWARRRRRWRIPGFEGTER